MKVHILLPLILMVKLHLQRHCSQQTPQTAITQKPSSSSLIEKQRIPCLEDLSGHKLCSTYIVFSHPSSLWLAGYRNVSVALKIYFNYTFLALYFDTFLVSIKFGITGYGIILLYNQHCILLGLNYYCAVKLTVRSYAAHGTAWRKTVSQCQIFLPVSSPVFKERKAL